eukprot:TRINITY_DN6902_c0_g1_i1.p1 TRINITY_DN6902_c0_g1~~TRINITY_DN6902_c0_g1_i1.p1  ORF type:complete len:108 (+),score=16.32 TRINITY_DN6902_c0_g1_i1:103-426(+)
MHERRACSSGAPDIKYANFHKEPPPLRPPKVPLKELFLSIGLFLAGTIMLLCGANVFFQNFSLSDAMPYNMIGGLCFIPGAYHSFIFLMIFNKVPGYSYDMISTFDT